MQTVSTRSGVVADVADASSFTSIDCVDRTGSRIQNMIGFRPDVQADPGHLVHIQELEDSDLLPQGWASTFLQVSSCGLPLSTSSLTS